MELKSLILKVIKLIENAIYLHSPANTLLNNTVFFNAFMPFNTERLITI